MRIAVILMQDSDKLVCTASEDPNEDHQEGYSRKPNRPKRRVANPAVVMAFIMMPMGAKTEQNRNRGQREEGHDVPKPLVGRQVHNDNWILRTAVRQHKFPAGNRQCMLSGAEVWLGDRDSNPNSTVQSRMSCRWTIPQDLKAERGRLAAAPMKVTQSGHPSQPRAERQEIR